MSAPWSDALRKRRRAPTPGDTWAAREAPVIEDSLRLAGSQLRFFDWLRGRGGPPPVISLEPAFANSDDAGPRRTQVGEAWFPHASGSLDAKDNSGEVLHRVHRSNQPVPSVQMDEIRWVGSPASDLAVSARDDVVDAWTDEIVTSILLSGRLRFSARIRVHPNRPAYLMVKLLDVGRDGISIRIAHGVARIPESDATVTVDLGPALYTLRAGRRLCLLVAASDFD